MSILGTSTINSLPIIVILNKLVLGIVFFIFCFKGLMDKYSYKEWYFLLILFILLVISWIKSGENYLLILFFPVAFSKNLDIKKFVKIYFCVSLVMILLIVCLSLMNIIPNYVYLRGLNIRQSFGIIYPTDFAAYVFYLSCGYVYIRNNKFNYIDGIITFLISYIVYLKTDARLNFICTIIVIVLGFLIKFNSFKFITRRNKSLFLILPSLFIVITTFFYNPDNNLFKLLNNLLSDRLFIVQRIFRDYGISLFGNKVYQNGLGGDAGQNFNFLINQYSYIDSAYLRMILMYGIVLSVVILFVLSCEMIKIDDDFLMIILVVIFVSGMVEMHMLQIAYNPFFIILTAEYFKKSDKVSASVS